MIPETAGGGGRRGEEERGTNNNWKRETGSKVLYYMQEREISTLLYT